MSDNALMMVHAPWTFAIGNADELRSQADILDQVRGTLVKTYQWHSDKDEEEMLALIAGPDGQGTWLDADAAIEAGLAHEKIEGLKAAASIHPKALGKIQIPEQFAERVQAFLATDEDPEAAAEEEEAAPPAPAADPEPQPAPEPEPVPADALAEGDVFRAVVAAGLDGAFAISLLEGGRRVTGGQLEAAVNAEKGKRAAEEKREGDIRALCAKHGLEDLAGGYVVGGMPFDQVKTQIAVITARLDKIEIDTGLAPDHGAGRKPVIDTAAVYRRMNAPATTKH